MVERRAAVSFGHDRGARQSARRRWSSSARAAGLLCCGALLGVAGCGGAAREPLAYDVREAGTNGDGRSSILVDVPRAYTATELRQVFEEVRAQHSEPEQAVFVAITCETGNDEAGADRLAYGRYAVGAVGQRLTRLAPGEAAFTVFKGRTCAPRSVGEEARSNLPAERADAWALEQSGGLRTGCGAVAPAARSAREPGCVYVAARSGCLYALTRSRSDAPGAVRAKLRAPALLEIHAFSAVACAPE